jgi:hypothetical protein
LWTSSQRWLDRTNNDPISVRIQRPNRIGTVSAIEPAPTPSGGFGSGLARFGSDTAS